MIQRIDTGKTMSRATVHNGVIYFGGHVAAGKQPTMTEQAKALLSRYEELLAMNGSDKDHIIFASIYVTDMALKDEFNAVWNEWLNPGCAPARVCVEVGLAEGYLVEVTLVAEKINA